MSATYRRQILEALIKRLETITRSNGFATDAGRAIYVGEMPALGPDDPEEAIAVVPGEDIVGWQREKKHIEWPVEIQALAMVTTRKRQPWMTVEDILGDIKRAVELEDRTLGGLIRPWIQSGTTRTIEREPGQAALAAGIVYVMPFNEVWGEP